MNDVFGGVSLRSFAIDRDRVYGWLVVDMGGDGRESVNDTDGFANDFTKYANDSERSVVPDGTVFFSTSGAGRRVPEVWFPGEAQAFCAHGFAYYNIIYIKN